MPPACHQFAACNTLLLVSLSNTFSATDDLPTKAPELRQLVPLAEHYQSVNTHIDKERGDSMQYAHLVIRSGEIDEVAATAVDVPVAASPGSTVVLRTLAVAGLTFAVLACQGSVVC